LCRSGLYTAGNLAWLVALNLVRPGIQAMRSIKKKFCLVATSLLAHTALAIAAMPEPDAWNIGSVLAAAVRCETSNYIAQGQATPLMMKLFSAISSEEQQFVRAGYLEGGKRGSVYSISQRQWFQVPLTAEACRAVQYTLDQYKTMTNSR